MKTKRILIGISVLVPTLALLVLLQAARASPGSLFVKPGGAGDCTQAGPCSLTTALAQAVDGDTIYVAAGIYTGTHEAVIKVTKSITLYGGWDGAASGAVVRDSSLHITTLDGENARRVIQITGNVSPTIDGFTITRGNATNATWDTGLGGGILSTDASPIVQNNVIVSNTASITPTSGNGGGIYLSNGAASTVISGNLVLSNVATIGTLGSGGGVYLAYGYITPTIVNNIIVSNTYGINAHTDASGTLDYNDVWGNTTQDYNLPGALEPGPHDIQADPRFVSTAEDDYHLRSGSLCINAGMNAGVTTDIDGQSRPEGFAPDLGADEYVEWRIFLPLVLNSS
jgi:hypothetical protein